jgi:hypothetical protein
MEEFKKFKNLKKFYEKNEINTFAEFLNNYVNLKGNYREISNNTFNEFSEIDVDKNLFFQELNFFLNNIANIINNSDILNNHENNYDSNSSLTLNIENFVTAIFGSKNTKQLTSFLYNLISLSNKNNLGSNLISYDWQLAIIERENEKTSTNMNKLEKIELAFQFKTYDKKTENYNSDTVKMGYSEFYEIFQNLKKIDGQLHMFKN